MIYRQPLQTFGSPASGFPHSAHTILLRLSFLEVVVTPRIRHTRDRARVRSSASGRAT